MQSRKAIRLAVHISYWYLIPHKEKSDPDDIGYRFLCFTIWVPRKTKKTEIQGFKTK